MKKTYHRWQDVRKKKLTPQQLEAIDQAVEQDLLALDLQAIRELIGKTQTDRSLPARAAPGCAALDAETLC